MARSVPVKRCLVVGFGNVLRGDDGLGPLIAQKLAGEQYPAGVDVRVVSLPQLDIGLIPQMQRAHVVIFVDARQDDDDALVAVARVEPRHPSTFCRHSTHCMGIDTLLHLSLKWYGKRPDCYLVMPKGVAFPIGRHLSETGRLAAVRARKVVMNILNEA